MSEKKKTKNVEKQLMHSPSCAVCHDVLSEELNPHVGTPTILTWPNPMWFLEFLFPKIKNQFWVRKCSVGKNDVAHEENIKIWPASLLPTMEDYGAVKIGKGIIFPFCNYLNKKSENTSLLTLQPHLVYCSLCITN